MMRTATLLLACLFVFGCKKKTENRANCSSVVIGYSAFCKRWTITVNGETYSSLNIPAQFQQNGLVVCASYTLYPNPMMCPNICCSGTLANITFMEH